MTWARTRSGRIVFAVCLAAFALAYGHSALALPDARDLAADRAERKRAASKGKPLPGTPDLSRLNERLAKRGLPDDSAMMIRIFKAESELEVWIHRGGNARYALFASYPICNWSGTLGPKLKEGDRQAPEGFYTVNLEQLEEQQDFLQRIVRQRLRSFRKYNEELLLLASDPLDDALRQISLALEVVEKRALGHADLLDDLVQRGAREAPVEYQCLGRHQYLLLRRVAACRHIYKYTD
jgi:hypothetical protein